MMVRIFSPTINHHVLPWTLHLRLVWLFNRDLIGILVLVYYNTLVKPLNEKIFSLIPSNEQHARIKKERNSHNVLVIIPSYSLNQVYKHNFLLPPKKSEVKLIVTKTNSLFNFQLSNLALPFFQWKKSLTSWVSPSNKNPLPMGTCIEGCHQ